MKIPKKILWAFSKIFKLGSLVGLYAVIVSSTMGYDPTGLFYIYELDSSNSSVAFHVWILWLGMVSLVPYWVGYVLDPDPNKGFLLKRWKL